MEMTITQKHSNVLLDRTEVQGMITFEGATPSNQHVAESIAKQLHADASLVVVRQVHNFFGQQKAEFLAVVYSSEEMRKKTEKVNPHMKKKLQEQKPAEQKK